MNLLTPQETQDTFALTAKFMENLKVGNSFRLINKNYVVKCIGKWKSDSFPKINHFKTLTVKCLDDNSQIKFFYFFGIEGNPKSKSKGASVKQHNFIRDVEGVLLVDMLNINNPFHQMSDIYKIAIQ